MLLEEARRLHDLGLNVLPIADGTKAPVIGWKTFQTERIPWDTVSQALQAPKRGLGVIMGEVSQNLAVLDFDDAEAYGRWSKSHADVASTLPTATSGRGFHVFIRLETPYNGKLRLSGESDQCGDLLGTRKLAVIPPTNHPSGKARTWVVPLIDLPPVMSLKDLGLEYDLIGDSTAVSTAVFTDVFTDVSSDVFTEVSFGVSSPESWEFNGNKTGNPQAVSLPVNSQGSHGVSHDVFGSSAYPEGTRHQSLLSFGGRLRNTGLNYPELESALLALNSKRCSPPLPVAEVVELARYLATREVHSPKEYERDDEDGTPYSDELHHGQKPKGNDGQQFEGMFLALPEYLIAYGEEDAEWLLDGFLPVGYLAILGGTSKAGKSCFLTSLALHVAEGRDFMDLETMQANVLWVALEETETERRIALQAHEGEPEGLYITHEKVYIDSKHGINALRYWVRKTGAKLLVIDPLYAANTAESLTDGNTARRVLQPLKDLCREEKVTAILIHHLNKNTGGGMNRERFADSNQLLASVSMDILMDSSDLADGTRELRLQCRGRGEFANQTWIVKSEELGDYQLVRHGKDADRASEVTDAKIIEVLDEGMAMTALEIAELIGTHPGTTRNRITALCLEKTLVPVGKKGRSKLYQLAGAQN